MGRMTTITLVAILAAGCRWDAPPTASRADAGQSVSLAKQVPNPRATFFYYDVRNASGAGTAGDGRDAGGAGATGTVSTYEDGRCGVAAEIFASGTGDATMNPIDGWNRLSPSKRAECGSQPRFVTVHFGSPIAGVALTDASGGYLTNVRQVLQMAAGESASRTFRLQMGGGGCDFLRYDSLVYQIAGGSYAGSQIRVQRLADIGGKRVWLAESVPNEIGQHVAACEVGVPATYRGVYDVPFRVELREK